MCPFLPSLAAYLIIDFEPKPLSAFFQKGMEDLLALDVR
jgi:hypothetical protein